MLSKAYLGRNYRVVATERAEQHVDRQTNKLTVTLSARARRGLIILIVL